MHFTYDSVHSIGYTYLWQHLKNKSTIPTSEMVSSGFRLTDQLNITYEEVADNRYWNREVDVYLTASGAKTMTNILQ